MRGFRDAHMDGSHRLKLGGVELPFGDDGVLWEPSEDQLAVLTTPSRSGRFVEVEPLVGKSPGVDDDEPLAGADFETAISEPIMTEDGKE